MHLTTPIMIMELRSLIAQDINFQTPLRWNLENDLDPSLIPVKVDGELGNAKRLGYRTIHCSSKASASDQYTLDVLRSLWMV